MYARGHSSRPRRAWGRGGRWAQSRSRDKDDLPEDLATRNAQRMGGGDYGTQPPFQFHVQPTEDVSLRGGRGRGGYNRGRRARGGGGSHRGARGGHHASEEGNAPYGGGWSFEEFREFAKQPPDELVRVLFENQAKLKGLLKRLNALHPTLLSSIVHVLEKITRSEEDESSRRLLAVFFDPNEAGSLWGHVSFAIKKMPLETSQELRDKNRDVLKRFCHIFQAALERIPQTAAPVMPINDLLLAVTMLAKNCKQYNNLLQQVTELQKFWMLTISLPSHEPTEQDDAKKASQVEDEEPMPFGDFRRVRILPNVQELTEAHGQNDKKVSEQVRPNKMKGGYRNWDHYLDVHFRLLREDFVFPLREGLQQFIVGSNERNTNVRVYPGVHVLEPVCLMSGIGFQIKFNVSKLQRVNWNYSRRLIFGALVCLSADGFQTIHFATVVDRTSTQLEKGIVTVKFEDDTNAFLINPSQEFVMLESSAYFEAYRHILNGLQQINFDLMPFSAYLVECKTSGLEIPPPKYLKHATGYSFDLHSILGVSKVSPRKTVNVTDASSWPPPEETQFNRFQLEAMQMALSQDVSVIQGPPGTGKTYVGVHIVEALLYNKAKWSDHANNPILIVCVTNHALDQFLGEILDKCHGKEPNVIRIGGRAKNDRMKARSLQTIRQEAKTAGIIPNSIHKPVARLRWEMGRKQEEVEAITPRTSAQESRVLPFYSLCPYISQKHSSQLTSNQIHCHSRDAGRDIEIWLGLWFPTPVELPTQEEIEQNLGGELDIDKEAGFMSDAEAFGVEDSEDEWMIQVDEEAQLLQEERVMEGEELLVLPSRGIPTEQFALHAHVPKSKVTANEYGWKVKQLTSAERKKRVSQGLKQSAMSGEEMEDVIDIWTLSPMDRWRLYQHWSQKYIRDTKSAAQWCAIEYKELCLQRDSFQQDLDQYILQNAEVVGMTTTGAAKYNYLLKRLSPKIVVVEEAAEVLESHILSCLSSGAQQLVLIGDHKQLRPKPTTYELVKDYNMALSLFERLVNNDFPHVTLQKQHRMRPEISKLLYPHIYDCLDDSDSVKEYPDISGVGKNLFFISHEALEDHRGPEDLSHSNQFEVDFVVALCRYLLKQGYDCKMITILTMYKGQLVKFRDKMPKQEFEGVRVAAVDDFQGEENYIVLLSLVRSNRAENVGFLHEKNRACVALSRAKWGLYVIGNFEMLRMKDGTPWPSIIKDAEERGFLGNALPLYCPNHPNTRTLVSCAAEFAQVPEGGCSKPCGTRLRCGHACLRTCHVADKEHTKIQCMKSCEKELPCGHRCKRRCYECFSGCTPCSERVSRDLPCGHQEVLPCYKDPLEHKCSSPCQNVLPCGHTCQARCGDPCTVRCSVKVPKTLSCMHAQEVACCIPPNDFKCPEPCESLLECGHPCPGTCSRCAGGRLHQPCSHPCNRNLPCGHVCRFPCTNACPPCEQSCRNYCNHSKCPRKCKEPCAPCMEQCQWQCEHYQCNKKCGELCDRPRCDQPCRKKLKCGHRCIGLCGEECPSLCRICNKDQVHKLLMAEEEGDVRFIQLKDCKHLVEVSTLDRWMDSQLDIVGTSEIQFIMCPKCKTPVLRSLRYGNIIKKSLRDMEDVKRAVWSEHSGAFDMKDILAELKQLSRSEYQLQQIQHYHAIHPHLESTMKRVEEVIADRQHTTSYHQKAGLQTRMQVLKALGDLLSRLGMHHTDTTFMIGSTLLKCKEMLDEIQPVLQYAMQHEYFSAQQLSDIETELNRLSLLTSWCEIAHKMQSGESHRVAQAEVTQLVKLVTYLMDAGNGKKEEKLTETYHDDIKKLFDSLKQRCGVCEQPILAKPAHASASYMTQVSQRQFIPYHGLWRRRRHYRGYLGYHW